MKILFIITQSEIGGAQRYLLELAPYLASHGHEVSVIAGEGDNELFKKLYETCNMKPETCHSVPSLVRNLNPIKDLIALFFLFKIIKKNKPDVLFLQSTKAGFLGALAAKIYKLYCFMFHVSCSMPVIYRIGGWSFRDPRAWWMNKILFWMEKISSGWKDVIIVNSELDRQIAAIKKIVPKNKIVKIHNGIDPDALGLTSREEAIKKLPITNYQLPITHETKIIGTIANLYATKGIEYLIEAAHILTLNPKPHTTSPIFVVIGEGKERAKLEALIKKYHLENHFFLLGRMNNARRYLKAFDIFVLSSVKEGFPWVLLEAMAAEVPVIAADVGAVPEVIENGKEGILIAPIDGPSIAKKILLLSEDKDSQDRYVKNASRKLKKFSLKAMLEQSEAVIKDS